MASLIPPEAYNEVDERWKQGDTIWFTEHETRNVEELVQALNDLEVDINGAREKVAFIPNKRRPELEGAAL